MTAFVIPVNAQNTLPTGTTNPTNLQEGGTVALPSGVTPDLTVETTAYLSFRPNPVGKGQTVLVNIWLTPATHVSKYIKGYVVTIEAPDGTKTTETLDSYRADATAWFEFTPEQTGTYKLKFENPGGYFPAGNYTIHAGAYHGTKLVDVYTNFTQSCYYTPSSTDWQELTVQDEMVASWPSLALPTDYWTRPVQPNNREWAINLGDYPWYGPGGGSNWPADTNTYTSAQYKWTPYVEAPNTAHIAWMKTDAIGGIIGGDFGQWSLTTGGGNPSIIYQGRGYQVITKANPTTVGQANYLQCYDIRTGKIYFERQMFTGEPSPTAIEYDTGTSEVPGAGASPLGGSHSLIAFSNGRLYKYNPTTGAMTANFSIAPLTTATYVMNGYAFGIQSITIGGVRSYRLINFTTLNNYYSATGTSLPQIAIQSNITWPWSDIGLLDLQAGYSAQATAITPEAAGAYYGTNIKAASLTTGQEVWNKNVSETMYSRSCSVADHGKVAVLMMDGCYYAYDLNTGNLAWKSEAMDYPWSSPGFGAYSVQSAYGLIYREGYDGVYAFNWKDGTIAWKFEAPANPYETPYTDENGTTVYSFNAGGILADGKIFLYNTEHTPSQPITRGWRFFCVNATSGEGIWNITGCMTPGAIADGYITASNSYDGYTYVFGKGQSATTISVPQTAIPSGQSVIISGTVLDESPAQPGTPCVSKESMTAWMEYLHMQAQVPMDVIGVPVSIDAVDPNGNSIHIATVTTDMSGTFGYAWTPEITGEYKITATFAGDDSYGSSWAQTYATVTEASEAPVTPTAISFDAINSTVTTTVIGGVIAIIIAIVLVGLLILRKRP